MPTFTANYITYDIIDGTTVNLVSATILSLTTIPTIDTVIDPSTGIKYSIRGIGSSAFSGGSNLTGPLVIGDSVRTIGNAAFSNCSGLNGTLTIGSGVTEIGNAAFQSCSSLTGPLVIGDSVTIIKNSAFFGCGFNGPLTIGNSVTTIGSAAFTQCSSLSGTITIGNSMTTIGSAAFRGCSKVSNYRFLGNAPSSIENNIFDNAGTPLPIIIYTSGTSGWPTPPGVWPNSSLYIGQQLETQAVTLPAPSDPSAPSDQGNTVGYASFNVFGTNFRGMGNLGDYY